MIVLVTSAFLAAGILVGRAWIVAVPLVVWPVWYLAVHFAGPGLGEGWWAGFLAVTSISVVLAALGVLFRRLGGGHGRRGAAAA